MSNAALLHRPLYGGPFGLHGRFSLATQPCVQNGLHAVRFMVIDAIGGGVLSISHDKVQALAAARRVLWLAGEAANDDRWEQSQLWSGDELLEPGLEVVKPVSRRRREVFERSEGRCAYCKAALTLDGRWHVEHQVPKALGGGDSPLNLVAACAPCNLAKRDRTSLEFVVSGDGERRPR